MSFFVGGAHTCALSSIRLRRCLVLVASKIRVPKSYVATGGCKIGIEKSDVKKSESFKGNGCRGGGLDILNYNNNVATSMDGHCYFCIMHTKPVVEIQITVSNLTLFYLEF